jgi:DNA-binding winged helix-turn-helix (wHTH) protein
MIYEFAKFELDTDRMELRNDGAPVAVEPQVFALLRLLIDHRDRMVSKDEIVDKVWNGRFISDAAIASRIKSARQVVGDDGKTQAVIRTVHGMGFAFVADVTMRQAISVAASPAPVTAEPALSQQNFQSQRLYRMTLSPACRACAGCSSSPEDLPSVYGGKRRRLTRCGASWAFDIA